MKEKQRGSGSSLEVQVKWFYTIKVNFKSIDLAWEAHKVRNNIAHAGVNFELTEREARKAFVMYESVLKDLKVI